MMIFNHPVKAAFSVSAEISGFILGCVKNINHILAGLDQLHYIVDNLLWASRFFLFLAPIEETLGSKVKVGFGLARVFFEGHIPIFFNCSCVWVCLTASWSKAKIILMTSMPLYNSNFVFYLFGGYILEKCHINAKMLSKWGCCCPFLPCFRTIHPSRLTFILTEYL